MRRLGDERQIVKRGDRWRGVLDTARLGHARARALAIADSRALVRALFVSSADRLGILPGLVGGEDLGTIAGPARVHPPDRLRAWLDVGVELGELERRGDLYVVRGRRSRAVAAGDPMLVAHYRSMLGYQVGPYAELAALLQSPAGQGRSDLEDQAADIAQVSLAAAPFVTRWLQAAMAERPPRRVLDIGCGTGVYSAAVLSAVPEAHVTGIDLAPAAIDLARSRLSEAGFAGRFDVEVGDARTWRPPAGDGFDAVLLVNNLYYFDPAERRALLADLGQRLSPGGELIVVTMTQPGSIAAAHLQFMLVCQAGAASLPTAEALDADLRAAGFTVRSTDRLVPTEPFVAVRTSLGAAR